MPRRILFGEELHKECKKTMEILHRAVASSLGPSGKLSLLDRGKQASLITKDGVTICRNCIPLADEAMNLIAGKILEIANKTNSESGDGTTTSIVLANALYEEALKYMKDTDPVVVAREIEVEIPKVYKMLEKYTEKIEAIEKMTQVATISCNNDSEIGKLIASAIDEVGQDGFVTLSEGDGDAATLTLTEGYQVDKGAFSERYLKGKPSMRFENPNILVYDGKIEDMNIIHDLYAQAQNSPLVVIAELGELPQKFLIENVKRGVLSAVHIVPPMFKETRVRILQDIAIAVGATLVNPFMHENGKQLNKSILGKAEAVTFTGHYTNIIRGAGKKEDILKRVEELKDEMSHTKSKYEADKVRERISKLTSGAAVIGVGGRTEDEIYERKDRFEDALNATRAALLEGIIPGGGFALFKIAQKMGDKTIGQKVLSKALEAPLRQIIKNTGVNVDEICEKIRKSKKGYDARNHKYVDLMKAGIVDPVKSTKSGLKNAVSIVDLLINLECLTVNILDQSNAKEMLDAFKNINETE